MVAQIQELLRRGNAGRVSIHVENGHALPPRKAGPHQTVDTCPDEHSSVPGSTFRVRMSGGLRRSGEVRACVP